MPNPLQQYSNNVTPSNILLKEKLEQINICVREKFLKEDKIGALEGLSGIALFQFYYAQFSDNDLYADWGQDTLIKIIEHINSGFNIPTFSSGISGAGWVFDHLKNNNFIDIDNDELLHPLDSYIHKVMTENLNTGNTDFLHGASGNAFYFLERYLSTQNKKLRHLYETYLIDFINGISKLVIYESDGAKWNSRRSFKDASIGTDLSLSHGMSSMVSILSELAQYNIFKEKCKILIDKAIIYMLKQELDDNTNSISKFPNWVAKSDKKDSNTRLGWCYGDFSVGIACYKASKVLNNKALLNKAHEILENTTLRTKENETQVIDAGICHGAFGNAQIYNYLYKDSQREIYKNAAHYWTKNGIEMGTFDNGYVGFMQHFGEGKWEPMLNLLEGVSGIGLCIIDHLSENKNNWDKCIQLG